MTDVVLGPTPAKQPAKRFAPLALGFRPFFLLAALAAPVLMTLWVLMWAGRLGPVEYYGLIGWHSHEMLFGYVVAVIAGFLLTAVRNWTGIPTPTGLPLAGLALLWLAGRLLPFAYPAVPGAALALVDWLFVPALVWALARPVWRGQNRVNRVFLGVLAGMALANLLVHLQALGIAPTADRAQTLMLNLLILLIALVGGRVIPFFTRAAIPGASVGGSVQLERWAYGALLGLILVELAYPSDALVALAAGAVALTQGLRLRGWHVAQVWRIPILWVLFAAFGWLVLGFALKALAALGGFPANLARHAVTVGGIGVLTVGMLARVTLGHTGRELEVPRLIVTAFVLLNVAATVRVFGPLLVPGEYTATVLLAGGLWVLAFLALVLVYTPMLVHSRVDGRPG